MKIIISGAGVAGLSSAIALRQLGFEVEIYERHQARQDIGAGIVCWPNASFVLDQLGLLDAVAECSGQPIRMQRFSPQGEDLGALDIKQLNHAMGYSSYSILRRDLMTILEQEALHLGAKIYYGQTVKSISQVMADSDEDGRAVPKNSQAQLELESGQTVQGDLILGADGRMNSLARAYVNGDNQPVFQKFINWIGVFESSESVFSEPEFSAPGFSGPVSDEIAVSDYWGVGQRFGVVPISNKKVYWAGAVACSEIGERDPANYKSDLKKLFSDWPEPIGALIEQTPISAINKIYVHDHEPIPTWHKDNLLLLGDAAHAPLPTSGQGACQALEDAWHLAQLLAKREDGQDLNPVLASFTQQRFAKNSGITQGARQLARSLFNTDPGYCRERNRISQKTDFSAMVQGMAKGWGSGLPLTL